MAPHRTSSNDLLGRNPTNVPVALTSFVGRSDELQVLREFLADARLVTLHGSGGVGKTRLALRLANDILDGYPDGVWLIELAPITDASLVPHVVASALGVRDRAGVSIMQSLTYALQPKRTLLVLDNCEHLVQACADLAESLLSACPGLQILATSREPLGATGEVAWRVPSLDLPDLKGPTTVEALAQHAATTLFIQRARAARPDFLVTPQYASAIVEVCRRLDGVPLALELAATRVRVLSVQQIASRLNDQLHLLAGGRRTAPSRHQTLRATLDWSYVLLREPQRRLFNRLAVFAGSWTLEAAEAICGGEGIEREEVLDQLAQLVDQSLVLAEEQSGRVRYRLLETMRQYAAEKLEESGESLVTRDRHLEWFLTRAESSPLTRDPDHVAWLAEEIDNLRAGLRWSIQRGAVESGLRLATATMAFWYQHGFYDEARAWLAEVLAQPGASGTVARATALTRAAIVTSLRGDVPGALALARKGLAIARELDDAAAIASAMNCEAWIAWHAGDAAHAWSLYEEALSVCQSNGLSATELGYYVLHGLAMLALKTGDSARAAKLGADCQALAERIGHVRGSANTVYVLGCAAAMSGDYTNGRQLLERALARYRQFTDWQGTAWCLRALAQIALEQGDAHAARRLFREDLGFAQASGETFELALSLEGLAGALVDSQPNRAVRLAAAAAVLRDAADAKPYPLERERLQHWLHRAEVNLGSETYAVAWADGRAMTPEQLFGLAGAEADDEPSLQPLSAVGLRSTDELSPREREVARLVATGRTNRQIAAQLVIAPRTADTHVRNILTKLDLHTRAELAVWAVGHGLSPPGRTNTAVIQ